MLTRYF